MDKGLTFRYLEVGLSLFLVDTSLAYIGPKVKPVDCDDHHTGGT